MNLITWNRDSDTLVLHQVSSWHELSSTGEYLKLRKLFQNLSKETLPFKSFITFPPSPLVIARFYCTWPLSATATFVEHVIEGRLNLVQPLTAPSLQPMMLPYAKQADSLYLRPPPKNLEPFLNLVRTTLQIEELALFHFLGKDLSPNDKVAIDRELKGVPYSQKFAAQHIPSYAKAQLV